MRHALRLAAPLLTIAGIALATASPVLAEVVPGRVAPTTLPTASKLRPPPSTPLKIIPFQPLLTFVPLPADMTGWTAITSGPSKGGASLATHNGATFLFVRGGDDDIYAAPFDPAHIAPVASSNWTAFGVKTTSEPECRTYERKFDGVVYQEGVCAYLGASGNAMYRGFGIETKIVTGLQPTDMGGSHAGAAPTFLKAPAMGGVENASYITYLQFGVWDGASGLFVKNDGWAVGFGAIGPSPDATKWAKLTTAFAGAPGCADDICAVISGKHVQLVKIWGDGRAPQMLGVSADLDAAPSGKPTVVVMSGYKAAVVVRGADGHVQEAFFDSSKDTFTGGWHDEKGYITKGSTPACTSVNTQPVCVVQGGNGKLYARALTGASGL